MAQPSSLQTSPDFLPFVSVALQEPATPSSLGFYLDISYLLSLCPFLPIPLSIPQQGSSARPS